MSLARYRDLQGLQARAKEKGTGRAGQGGAMPRESILERRACGCQIRKIQHDDFTDSYIIEYCPKHKATPTVYETLQCIREATVVLMGKMSQELKEHLQYIHTKATRAKGGK